MGLHRTPSAPGTVPGLGFISRSGRHGRPAPKKVAGPDTYEIAARALSSIDIRDYSTHPALGRHAHVWRGPFRITHSLRGLEGDGERLLIERKSSGSDFIGTVLELRRRGEGSAWGTFRFSGLWWIPGFFREVDEIQ